MSNLDKKTVAFKLNEILNSVVPDYDFCEWRAKPFVLDDKVYATDSFKCVGYDYSMINDEFTYEEPMNDMSVEAKNIIKNMFRNESVLGSFDAQKFLKDFEQIPTYTGDEDIECEECEGTGEVEWEHGKHTKDDDCPECDGKGYISSGLAYVECCDCYFCEDDLIKLEPNVGYGIGAFAAANMKLVAELIKIFNAEKCYILSSSIPKVLVFQIGDVKIGIMPLNGIKVTQTIVFTVNIEVENGTIE